MTSSTPEVSTGERMRAFALTAISPRGAVFLLLIVLLVGIIALNPSFADPSQLIRFAQRVAPIAIVAIGQYFVIVSGEFDLSQGSLVTTQVVVAGTLIGDDDARVLPVMLLMVGIGVVVGLINGFVTTRLKVPSFIVTLGMMLALLGGVFYWTGGSATGNPTDSFRQIGRGGIRDVPVFDIIPWAVVILVVVMLAAVWFTRRPSGRLVMAVGDNATAARYSGVRTARVKTQAFVLSSLAATLSAWLLVGYAGVHPSVGRGYEFTAITAVVLGGTVLGGGRGWVISAAAGAFALEALFTLLNFAGVPSTMRDAVQGFIIIAAVAYAASSTGARWRNARSMTSPPGEETPDPQLSRAAQHTSTTDPKEVK